MNKKVVLLTVVLMVLAALLSACAPGWTPDKSFGLGTCSKWNSCPTGNGIVAIGNAWQALLVGALAVSLGWNRIRRKAIFAVILVAFLLSACGSPVKMAGGDQHPGWNQPISTR